jgi:hypothetical protein
MALTFKDSQKNLSCVFSHKIYGVTFFSLYFIIVPLLKI